MGIMIIIYHYRAYGAFILGDTLLMSLMKLSPTGSYLFNGFFTPDVECSDRRISSKFAQCVGPILLYLAGYDYDFIKKQMTRIEAKSSLATHHRQWKPHSVILSLIEKGKADPAFYMTLKAVNLLMRWSLGTTYLTESGRIVRSLHGLASGVAGHSAITTMVYGLTLQAMRNYRAAHDLDEDTYDAGYMAEYFSKMGPASMEPADKMTKWFQIFYFYPYLGKWSTLARFSKIIIIPFFSPIIKVQWNKWSPPIHAVLNEPWERVLGCRRKLVNG